jgi:hypothetical protein
MGNAEFVLNANFGAGLVPELGYVESNGGTNGGTSRIVRKLNPMK